MKSAKTQTAENVCNVHLLNATNNKAVRVIHMPTHDEAIRMFIRYVRNHNELARHYWNADTTTRNTMPSLTKKIAIPTWTMPAKHWKYPAPLPAKFLIAAANVDKAHFTHDSLHLFETLSDTWSV